MASANSPSHDMTKDRALLAIFWTQFAIALVFVLLRFYARFSIHAIGMDDWVITITMILDTASTVILTIMMKHNLLTGSQHQAQIVYFYLLFFILQPITSMAVAIGRASVAILLLRIVGRNNWCKYILYFSIISTLLLSSVYSITIFFQCKPISANWDDDKGPGCSKSYRDGVTILAVFVSSWNALQDIGLALISVYTFFKLQLDKKRKVGFSVLMSLGVIASAAAAIKAWKYIDENSNLEYAVFELYAVSGVELLLIIVCACVPTLIPLYPRCNKRRTNSIRLRSWHPTERPRNRPSNQEFELLDNIPHEATHSSSPGQNLASKDEEQIGTALV